jgi:hypothetical protein
LTTYIIFVGIWFCSLNRDKYSHFEKEWNARRKDNTNQPNRFTCSCILYSMLHIKKQNECRIFHNFPTATDILT